MAVLCVLRVAGHATVPLGRVRLGTVHSRKTKKRGIGGITATVRLHFSVGTSSLSPLCGRHLLGLGSDHVAGSNVVVVGTRRRHARRRGQRSTLGHLRGLVRDIAIAPAGHGPAGPSHDTRGGHLSDGGGHTRVGSLQKGVGRWGAGDYEECYSGNLVVLY